MPWRRRTEVLSVSASLSLARCPVGHPPPRRPPLCPIFSPVAVASDSTAPASSSIPLAPTVASPVLIAPANARIHRVICEGSQPGRELSPFSTPATHRQRSVGAAIGAAVELRFFPRRRSTRPTLSVASLQLIRVMAVGFTLNNPASWPCRDAAKTAQRVRPAYH